MVTADDRFGRVAAIDRVLGQGPLVGVCLNRIGMDYPFDVGNNQKLLT
jgi:hypothetical protein